MINPVFRDFANLWVAICSGGDVPMALPIARTLAGERIVLFRDGDGSAHALIDRCPHRGVALSLGKVEAGHIVCPFHGWRFDGAGRCTTVPWNPEAKRGALSARLCRCAKSPA